MPRKVAKIQPAKQREFRRLLKQLREDRPQWMKDMHAEAKAKGLDKLTMREINETIAEVRREHDPLYGQTRRISLTISERMYRQAQAAAGSAFWDLSMLIRQAMGDFLYQLKNPRAPKNVIFSEPERRRIAKAIAESTPTINNELRRSVKPGKRQHKTKKPVS